MRPGGCFTDVSRALRDILSKFVYLRSSTCEEGVGRELCACVQGHALGSRTGFRLGVLAIRCDFWCCVFS